jgi:hypothetical protein
MDNVTEYELRCALQTSTAVLVDVAKKLKGREATEVLAAIMRNRSLLAQEPTYARKVGHHKQSHDGPCEPGCYYETIG